MEKGAALRHAGLSYYLQSQHPVQIPAALLPTQHPATVPGKTFATMKETHMELQEAGIGLPGPTLVTAVIWGVTRQRSLTFPL